MEHELFVPGRLCLFGEHSDWAGGYRRSQPEIFPGYCLITGTEQGIWARVSPDPAFRIESRMPDMNRVSEARIPFTATDLLRAAAAQTFASYAAGTAHVIRERYSVSGIRIHAYDMDLPLKKGLSSSAAICVLTARAFNRVYDLGLTIEQEMEAAYQGELLAGSQCGRMDQGCAFGRIPVFLTFDGDDMTAAPLTAGADLHLLIVDVKGEKDTRKILADLNRTFQGQDAPGEAIREGLGPRNAEILSAARKVVEAGDAVALGWLMQTAQANFDQHVMPGCPDQLAAPRLRQVLNHPAAKALSTGGKGVGSQGDGCAQLVFTGPDARQECRVALEKDLGVPCLDLTIPRGCSD